MKTIGVAELKAHLSRELRRVAAGESLIVTDHARAVALLTPLPTSLPITRPATAKLHVPEVGPLISSDPLHHLAGERADQ